MRVLLITLCLLLAGCRERAPAAAPVRFEPQARPLAKTAARDPKVVVRASGDVFALVARHGPEGADAVVLQSSDHGDHFSQVAVLNQVPGEVIAHGETAPRLLLGPRSEFYAVWTASDGLKVSRSFTYGRSFEPPVTAMPDAPSFYTAGIAPDGTLLVAWLGTAPGKPKGAAGTTHLNVAASKDRGATFELFLGVATDVCPCCRPAIVGDASGRWYLAWRAVSAGSVRDMVAAVSADRGQSWSPPVPVSNDGWKINGCPHSGPALQVAGSRLHIAWYSEAEGNGRTYWTRSPLESLAFEPRRLLSSGVKDANHPVLAAEADTVWAAFQGRDAQEREGWGAPAIYVRPLRDDAPAPLPAPRGAGSASHPELRSLGAGRWLVAWSDQGEEHTQAVTARFRVEADR